MQVKPALRMLRKKANKAAKEALSLPSAYGELMTVTRPGAKPSSHACNLLKGEARIPDHALVKSPPCAVAQDAIQLNMHTACTTPAVLHSLSTILQRICLLGSG